MRRRPPHIPQRRRIFLGCEGQGERGYGTLLARIAREVKIHVHIDARLLQPGAGDPRALVERAAQIIEHDGARREPFEIKAVLLDLGTPAINIAAAVLAAHHGTPPGCDRCEVGEPSANRSVSRRLWVGNEQPRLLDPDRVAHGWLHLDDCLSHCGGDATQ